jgi:hypothetical protein
VENVTRMIASSVVFVAVNFMLSQILLLTTYY